MGVIRKTIAGQRQPLWYSLVAILVSGMLLGITSLYLSKRAGDVAQQQRRESERQWCELLITLDNAYNKTPPRSSNAVNVAQEIHRLRLKFEC